MNDGIAEDPLDTPLHAMVKKAIELLRDDGNDDIKTWKSMRKRQLLKIERMIRSGADAHWKNSKGETPYSIAVNNGDICCIESMKKALEALRTSLTVKDGHGNTSLHKAVMSRDVQLIDELLKNGLKTNSTNKWKMTPLHMAVRIGDVSILKSLLSNRDFALSASTMHDMGGSTPLHEAASSGRKDIVKMMIRPFNDRTAELINSKNAHGNTPAEEAALNGHMKLAKFLRKDPRASMDICSKAFFAAMLCAMTAIWAIME